MTTPLERVSPAGITSLRFCDRRKSPASAPLDATGSSDTSSVVGATDGADNTAKMGVEPPFSAMFSLPATSVTLMVDIMRGEHGDTGVSMLLVIPGEEGLAERGPAKGKTTLEGEPKKSSRRRRLIRWGDGMPQPFQITPNDRKNIGTTSRDMNNTTNLISIRNELTCSFNTA